jgi:hypothetical protein
MVFNFQEVGRLEGALKHSIGVVVQSYLEIQTQPYI